MDRAEYVYVTQFGRHVATYDGANDEQAGLHFKWPWPIESVQRFDHRLQYFDLPGAELMTRDAQGNTIDKTLTVDAYVCWRIADAERRRSVHPRGRHAGGSAGHPRPAHQQRTRRRHQWHGVGRSHKVKTDRGKSQRHRRASGGREARILRKRLLETGKPSLQETAGRSTASRWWTFACGASIIPARPRRRSSTASSASATRRWPTTRARASAGRGHRQRQRRRVTEMEAASRGRGDRSARPGRRRGRPHPQRGAGERSAVLLVPQEAGRISAHPRRQQDDAAALDASRTVRHAVPAAEAA